MKWAYATCVAAHRKIATYWHMLPEATQARKAIWDAINPKTGKRRIDEAFPVSCAKRPATTRCSSSSSAVRHGRWWVRITTTRWLARPRLASSIPNGPSPTHPPAPTCAQSLPRIMDGTVHHHATRPESRFRHLQIRAIQSGQFRPGADRRTVGEQLPLNCWNPSA